MKGCRGHAIMRCGWRGRYSSSTASRPPSARPPSTGTSRSTGYTHARGGWRSRPSPTCSRFLKGQGCGGHGEGRGVPRTTVCTQMQTAHVLKPLHSKAHSRCACAANQCYVKLGQWCGGTHRGASTCAHSSQRSDSNDCALFPQATPHIECIKSNRSLRNDTALTLRL